MWICGFVDLWICGRGRGRGSWHVLEHRPGHRYGQVNVRVRVLHLRVRVHVYEHEYEYVHEINAFSLQILF
jgi:hypothetical protein